MTNIEKLIERMGKQPIESAPRDGTRILIDNPNWHRSDSPELSFWNGSFWEAEFTAYSDEEIAYWQHTPTGKEGEVMRVLVEALRTIENWESVDGDHIACAHEALAKAEELAGEV